MAHLMAHPQTPLYKESQSVSNLSPSLSQSQQLSCPVIPNYSSFNFELFENFE